MLIEEWIYLKSEFASLLKKNRMDLAGNQRNP